MSLVSWRRNICLRDLWLNLLFLLSKGNDSETLSYKILDTWLLWQILYTEFHCFKVTPTVEYIILMIACWYVNALNYFVTDR